MRSVMLRHGIVATIFDLICRPAQVIPLDEPAGPLRAKTDVAAAMETVMSIAAFFHSLKYETAEEKRTFPLLFRDRVSQKHPAYAHDYSSSIFEEN